MVLGLLQDPLVEVKPGQLPVDEAVLEGLQGRQEVLGVDLGGVGGGGRCRGVGRGDSGGRGGRADRADGMARAGRAAGGGGSLLPQHGGRRRRQGLSGGRCRLRAGGGDGGGRDGGGRGADGAGSRGRLAADDVVEVLVLVLGAGVIGEVARIGDLDDVLLLNGLLAVLGVD